MLRRLADRLQVVVLLGARDFVRSRDHRVGAQLAFFALVSVLPMAMLLVATFGAVVGDDEARSRVIGTLLDEVPLSSAGDRPRLEAVMGDALANAGGVGPLTVLVLVISASAVLAALRHALNVAFDVEERRGVLRRKAIDLALVLSASALLLVSVLVGGTRAAARDTGDWPGGDALEPLLRLVADLLPMVVAFVALTAAFAWLPTVRARLRDVWPGALLSVVLLELAGDGLEVYFERLSDYQAIYGSLAALVALLLYAWIAAMAVLAGAEVAAEWTRSGDPERVRRLAAEQREAVRARLPRRFGGRAA